MGAWSPSPPGVNLWLVGAMSGVFITSNSPPQNARGTTLFPRALLLRGVLASLVGIAGMLPGDAWADDSHYQNFVVGGRAVSLGGAFTSLSDDPSGAYYNPAGLADVEETSYSVSTSLYGFERGGYGGSLVLPVAGLESLNVQFTELIIVPASAGVAGSFGEPGPDGKPVQSYALSLVVPSFRTFTATDLLGASAAAQGSILREDAPIYSRRVTDRQLWAGAAYARKLSPRLRVGVSAFYILRSASDVESLTTRASIDDGDGNAGNDPQVFRTALNDIAFLNGSLVFIGGAKLLLTDDLTFGLSVQTPSIPLHSESTLRFNSAASVPACDRLGLDAARLSACQDELGVDPVSQIVTRTIHGASETSYPATLRAGASYTRPNAFTVAADVSAYLPTQYRLIVSPELDDALLSRIPFNPQVVRNLVVNVNVGGEFLVIPEVSIAAGFFTDFSSAPPIARVPEADAPPKVDLYGMSLTLGYFGKHSLSRIGVLYSFGEGQDVIPNSDVARLLRQDETYQRVPYFQSFFYVFVSSTFRY